MTFNILGRRADLVVEQLLLLVSRDLVRELEPDRELAKRLTFVLSARSRISRLVALHRKLDVNADATLLIFVVVQPPNIVRMARNPDDSA